MTKKILYPLILLISTHLLGAQDERKVADERQPQQGPAQEQNQGLSGVLCKQHCMIKMIL